MHINNYRGELVDFFENRGGKSLKGDPISMDMENRQSVIKRLIHNENAVDSPKSIIPDYISLIKAQRCFFRTQKTKSLDFRIEQLKKLKTMIRGNEKRILEALKRDLNKPEFETYLGEIGGVLGEIDEAIKNLKTWAKSESVKTPLHLKPASSRIIPEPYGVVAVFAPWNYPVNLLLTPTVGAIAAGNCVVLKPSELTPFTQKLMVELINSTFEKEYIVAIDGGTSHSEKLLEQKFDFIFFTGSPRVGRIVMSSAAKNLTPICLELGGKSPCIVDEETNLEVAAKRIVWAKFFNAGQTCVAPDYIYVPKTRINEFLKLVKNQIEQNFYQNTQEEIPVANIVNKQHFYRLISYIDKEHLFCGGVWDQIHLKIFPTVLNNITWDHPVMQDEIFGPIMPILTYSSLDEVIDIVNSRPKPLALYFFSDNKQNQKQILQKTSSGGAAINDCIIQLGNPNLPFGGVGESGMGSYHGKKSFETFSHAKSVFYNSTLIDNPLRYPPYSGKKLSWIKKLIG